jgi:hypothetical protein
VNAGIESWRGQDVVEVMPDFEVPAMKLTKFAMEKYELHANPRLTHPDPINSLVDVRTAAVLCTFVTLRYRPRENPRVARLQRRFRAGTVARNPYFIGAEPNVMPNENMRSATG